MCSTWWGASICYFVAALFLYRVYTLIIDVDEREVINDPYWCADTPLCAQYLCRWPKGCCAGILIARRNSCNSTVSVLLMLYSMSCTARLAGVSTF